MIRIGQSLQVNTASDSAAACGFAAHIQAAWIAYGRRKIMCCPNASATLNGAQKAFPILIYCLERGCLQFWNFRAFSVHSKNSEFSEFKKVQNKKKKKGSTQGGLPLNRTKRKNIKITTTPSAAGVAHTPVGILDTWETLLRCAEQRALPPSAARFLVLSPHYLRTCRRENSAQINQRCREATLLDIVPRRSRGVQDTTTQTSISGCCPLDTSTACARRT
jgi:hypothetical protein